ncbi:ABC transporter glutamine-binding protein GlnH precursor [Streptomyces lavendulae subsp. lavendulae]|uniref:ABC transporter glutamine-binding protein GlnH n=1 Tax=Streptomyces lavendulae subsp. lavendulae TaxID=58340 RepID=A0A2K8PRI6_STRLA|nr:glutamate ABC transporter substrate-binding protein [Streptomyces lavendulae]ATZ29367.1 ABC transporter glutamine-binding protein GlnH precursor [Streptomyces lavendulae subsp. lavendulae]QUQ59177.1 ABC transporter glutamine-binding protein GlnH [Streptomyces lavendulae subsp. lavendulae]
MKVPKAGAMAAVIGLALTATGCGGDEGPKGTLSIGIAFDQPGVGLREAGGTFSGFDVDVSRYIAKELGYKPEQIEFKRVDSSERELLLQYNEVKFVAATYSINDQRREKVDFAGPYFTAHQDLLVRADDATITKAEDLNNKRLCSTAGSTSAQNVKQKLAPKASLLELDGYSECVIALQDGLVDAMTTDNAILAGYAAQKGNTGKFRLVGLNLSNESYGIGIKKGNRDLQAKINAALKKMVEDGSWEAAVKKNFGQANFKHEPAPQVTSASS